MRLLNVRSMICCGYHQRVARARLDFYLDKPFHENFEKKKAINAAKIFELQQSAGKYLYLYQSYLNIWSFFLSSIAISPCFYSEVQQSLSVYAGNFRIDVNCLTRKCRSQCFWWIFIFNAIKLSSLSLFRFYHWRRRCISTQWASAIKEKETNKLKWKTHTK